MSTQKRYVTMLIVVAVFSLVAVFVNSSYRVKPSAPMTMETVAKLEQLKDKYNADFLRDYERANGSFGARAEVIGYYWNKIYDELGYSFDETVYVFLTDESVSQFQKAQFAQGAFIANLMAELYSDHTEVTEAFLRTNAISQRTLNLVMEGVRPNLSAREIVLPIIKDWVHPKYPNFIKEGKINMRLSPHFAEGDWEDAIIYRSYNPHVFYLLGTSEDIDENMIHVIRRSQDIDRIATIEGYYREYLVPEWNYKVAVLDRSRPVKLTFLKDVTAYE